MHSSGVCYIDYVDHARKVHHIQISICLNEGVGVDVWGDMEKQDQNNE